MKQLDPVKLDVNLSNVNRINKTVILRLYPSVELQDALWQLSGNERYVWNYLVRFNHLYHQLYPDAQALTKYELIPLVTRLKKAKSFLKLNDATGIQKVVERYCVSLQKMLNYYQQLKAGKHPKKSGFPSIRGRKRDLHAFGGKVVASNVKVVNHNHLKLPKFKQEQQTSSTVDLTGWQIKEYRVVLRGDGHYELILFVEGENQVLKHSGKIIGVDCNVKNLCVLSNGKSYPAFRGHRVGKLIHQSRIYQRKMFRAYHRAKVIMAREEAGHALIRHSLLDFKNYWKYRRLFNYYNIRIKQLKKQYLMTVANDIVKRYDVIVLENLQVKNMMHNHHIAEAIADSSWYEFRRILAYKCLWNNKLLITVPAAYTTQKCHSCGFMMGSNGTKKLSLNQRDWFCPVCHVHQRRDQNAALNIRDKFLSEPQKYLQRIQQKHLHELVAYRSNSAKMLKPILDEYTAVFTK